MKFETRKDARYYLNTHTQALRAKLHIVKTRYWSMDEWDYVPCYTVVMI